MIRIKGFLEHMLSLAIEVIREVDLLAGRAQGNMIGSLQLHAWFAKPTNLSGRGNDSSGSCKWPQRSGGTVPMTHTGCFWSVFLWPQTPMKLRVQKPWTFISRVESRLVTALQSKPRSVALHNACRWLICYRGERSSPDAYNLTAMSFMYGHMLWFMACNVLHKYK